MILTLIIIIKLCYLCELMIACRNVHYSLMILTLIIIINLCYC